MSSCHSTPSKNTSWEKNTKVTWQTQEKKKSLILQQASLNKSQAINKFETKQTNKNHSTQKPIKTQNKNKQKPQHTKPHKNPNQKQTKTHNTQNPQKITKTNEQTKSTKQNPTPKQTNQTKETCSRKVKQRIQNCCDAGWWSSKQVCPHLRRGFLLPYNRAKQKFHCSIN